MSLLRTLALLTVATALNATSASLAAQVGPNDVALGKSAFQSSIWDGAHLAGKAVDGNTNGNHGNNSTTHTQFDSQAWWFVDLGGNYDISSIVLWNRTDCCGSRLADFFVSVLAAGTSNVHLMSAPTVWQAYHAGPMGTTGIFTPTPGTVGQYVKVQLTGSNYLQLAEVDVEGSVFVPITTTPEPSSVVLLATGLVGLALGRRRRLSS